MATKYDGKAEGSGDRYRMSGHADPPRPKTLVGVTAGAESPPRELGEQVREEVVGLGLTPHEISYLCGVSRDSARKVTGPPGSRSVVSDAVALRICSHLGLGIAIGPPDPATRARLEEAHHAFAAFSTAARQTAGWPDGVIFDVRGSVTSTGSWTSGLAHGRFRAKRRLWWTESPGQCGADPSNAQPHDDVGDILSGRWGRVREAIQVHVVR